jgi:spore coat polysaccharide biosynthesis protein SpsF (cytidylyltransferase family)
MKVLAITQARLSSTRLPGKVLMKISNMSIIEIHLRRLLKSKLITNFKLATTNEPGIDEIIKIAIKLNIPFYKGSIDNVLDRFFQASINEQPDYVVRVTSDCPLIDPILVDKIIEFTIKNNLDYCSNTLASTYPDGVDVEVFKFSALIKAHKEATLLSEKEHVTPYIWKNSTYLRGSIFNSDCYKNEIDFSKYRITIDTIEDFLVLEKLVNELGIDKKWEKYINYLEMNPTIFEINDRYKRNEGYQKSLNQEKN